MPNETDYIVDVDVSEEVKADVSTNEESPATLAVSDSVLLAADADADEIIEVDVESDTGTDIDITADIGISGGGIADHRLLLHRDAPEQHPMSAITGLNSSLASMNAAIDTRLTGDEEGIIALQLENVRVNSRLEAAEAVIDDLDTTYAHITNGVIDNATIDSADVNNLDANYAHLTNGVIDNATISYADVDDLDANYAEIDLANVNNAWIDSGILKDASITDAKIVGVSANKLTAGTIDASNITVTNLNASNITAGSLTVDGITIDIDNNEASIDGSYIEEGTVTLNGLSQEVTDKIDGAIETFTGNVVPTLNNYPASSWTTSAIKDTHIGDVYYVINAGNQADGYCYRFAKNSGTYQWVLIKDSDVTAALQRLTEAEGDIDDLEAFESTTSSWITDTDEELSSIKTNVTNLTTRMGDAEDEIETKVDTSTFNTLSQTVGQNSANITSLTTITTNNGLTSSTNITDTVNTVSQTASGNSSKISSLTTTLGTNADGTTKAGDVVQRASALEQDLSGFKMTVEETYATQDGLIIAEAAISQKIDKVETATGIDLISNINAVADQITLSANQINFTNNTTVASELSALNSAISIDTTAPSVRIGNPENFYILITDTEMGFYQHGVVVPIAYMNGSELYVENSLSFGRFVFTQRDNHHFTLKLID